MVGIRVGMVERIEAAPPIAAPNHESGGEGMVTGGLTGIVMGIVMGI